MQSCEDENECKECHKIFKNRRNFKQHVRRYHQKREEVVCSYCGIMFSSLWSLTRHKQKKHNDQKHDHIYSHSPPKTCTRNNRLLCPVEDCVESFTYHKYLREHLSAAHNIECELDLMEFHSVEDFRKWKSSIQQGSISLYVQDTASKRLANNQKKQYYHCNRSNHFISKGRGHRTMKSVGTNKIGKTCPSRIEVTVFSQNEEEVNIKVKYYKTHCGHALQLGHIFLDDEAKAMIAGKLKEGVCFNYILDSIRDNVSGEKDQNKRLSIVERKDLHNIMRDFNIDHGIRRHQNDAMSVKLWVTEMQQNADNPILYHKVQDELDQENFLLCNDYALMIMTEYQAEQFVKFGENKICIDGTHGTNAYDIQLYTIMVVDEFGSGCPVAYCFSNRSDEYIFTLFFNKIKQKIGQINTSVFMTDDAPAFYNAWVSVMGRPEHKLLCSWHIDKNWRANLNKICDSGIRALVYKKLKVLQYMIDETKFEMTLPQVIEQLIDNEDTRSFGQYFQNHYSNRTENWAYCYRKGLGLNTNMYLESFHKILKHIYLEGRKVKRLDKTIDAVMKLARDSLFKRLVNITKNKKTEKAHQIDTSHNRSQSISSNSIETIEEGKQWLVKSEKSSFQYHVKFLQETCSDSCLKCSKCNICIHTYECTCNDNIIKLNICKHIHACVKTTAVIENSSGPIDSQETNEVDRLLQIAEHSTPQNISSNVKLVEKFQLVMGLLSKTVLSSENYSKLEKNADRCLCLLNEGNQMLPKVTQKVNTLQKVDKQIRLYSNKRKNKRHLNELKKPSPSEGDVIIKQKLS